jgi:thioredoxin-like negative regulator of GroEL
MGILKWLGFDGACEKEPVSLDDDNFVDEVRRSSVPVMVDVWSNGCQPCMALVPTIKRLACKYEGKVKVAELNASAAPKTLARLGIRGTPTVLFFKNGTELERVVGVRGQHYYEEIIEEDLLEEPMTQEAV